jgi:hypothetical protein
VRSAIMREIMARVRTEQAWRTARLNLALTAIGAVSLVILSALAMLQWRVVRPLAQLGLAITRIAAGDRRMPLTIRSTTREINAMVTVVETLRLAALVADATALRQSEAAARRLHALREVLGILRTVYEPSQSLERGVASLSQGIDATIAIISTLTSVPPATLDAAANAVRIGLRDMRDASRDLEATFAAARQAEMEDRPEAEIVACILEVRAHIERRDALVRSFIRPCLLALQDATSLAGDPLGRTLHDLIGDQFRHIETTVATLASMHAAVTQAATIVRELPLEVAPIAA